MELMRPRPSNAKKMKEKLNPIQSLPETISGQIQNAVAQATAGAGGQAGLPAVQCSPQALAEIAKRSPEIAAIMCSPGAHPPAIELVETEVVTREMMVEERFGPFKVRCMRPVTTQTVRTRRVGLAQGNPRW